MLIDLLRAKQSIRSFFASEIAETKKESCGCGSNSGGCQDHKKPDGYDNVLNKSVSRRKALSTITQGLIVGAGLTQTACNMATSTESREKTSMKWDEYFKTNYRLMTDEERGQTVDRLQKLYEMRTGKTVSIGTDAPVENVLYGYAFNVSKCQGYMDCVNACVEENNQDRSTQMQYIRIHEIENGKVNFDGADDNFFHEVPAAGHFYMGTQCFHCENAPCIEACPVGATWQEEDGIVVIDYDWCIGCRYCMAACPYDGRRFNWKEPEIPEEEINLKQHYLGNRPRKKGVMEKCTFCIQRSRSGKNPACVDACPTGARVFGNLLDPNSQIRWVLENKKVFRLKEELGTEPKFWYFMD
ncbi:4Fe-4S dicluster domain-containing protein [bacterium SCSIO 12741]|nr:4Fe-4S dicluster domain-containing protein [bacterium SCSIO 12741]